MFRAGSVHAFTTSGYYLVQMYGPPLPDDYYSYGYGYMYFPQPYYGTDFDVRGDYLFSGAIEANGGDGACSLCRYGWL